MNPMLPLGVSTDSEVTDPKIAILPVGSFEQHGPHLPLSTDALIAVAITNAITGHNQLRQLPPITISCSHEHAAFPGTTSITATTLAAVITDIAESLKLQGINKLLIINAHGGNYVLSNIVQQANINTTTMALYPTRQDWQEARHAAGMTTDASQDMHAGELETSILLAAYPDTVRDSYTNADHTNNDRRDMLTRGLRAYSQNGVIGTPSQATPDKGQAALQMLAENAQQIIKILNETSPSQ